VHGNGVKIVMLWEQGLMIVPVSLSQGANGYSHQLTRLCWKIAEEEVIVRPLSTVEYTSVASLFHCRQLV